MTLLDFGMVQLEVGKDDLRPSLIMAKGKLDKITPLSAGPTMMKVKEHEFHRTLAMSFAELDGADAEEALKAGLNQVQVQTGGKVSQLKEFQIHGQPVQTMELRYHQGDIPLVTYALITFGNGYLQSMMFTALDNPKIHKEAAKQFQGYVDSFAPGGLLK